MHGPMTFSSNDIYYGISNGEKSPSSNPSLPFKMYKKKKKNCVLNVCTCKLKDTYAGIKERTYLLFQLIK